MRTNHWLEPATPPRAETGCRFIPSGVWHVIVDTGWRPTVAEQGAYGTFTVPRPLLTQVSERAGQLTLTLRWDHGIVIVEHAQRAFADPRALTPEELSDAFFAVWRARRRAPAPAPLDRAE